ncbi:MAG TPA: helix-turn-helix domain-containing protein [Rhizomicrobium sp.]|nr:helix-turn-helix domain-containing protein [Rhizomicrobium sp.]
MQETGSYGQFCPVAMAAEIVCTRWTPLILRELAAGSTRFNDLRRGLPRISPTLLSKRLKELEGAGVIERIAESGENSRDTNVYYVLTPAGQELKAFVSTLGVWGQRWIETRSSLKHLDPSLLMWDMRRNLDPRPMLPGRSVIQIVYPELPASKRAWWLIVDGGETDLCRIDPGFEVDLYVSTDLRTMTSIWMGLATVAGEERAGRLRLTGNDALKSRMQLWLGRSPFAVEQKRVA